MIRLVCPHCGTVRELERRWLGQRTVCLGCGKAVRVRSEPDRAGTVAAAPPRRTRSARRASAAPPEPARAAGRLTVHCPSCARRYQFHDDCVGVSVECYRCGTRFTILTAAGDVAAGDDVPAAAGPDPAEPGTGRRRSRLHTPLRELARKWLCRFRRRTDNGSAPDPADQDIEPRA